MAPPLFEPVNLGLGWLLSVFGVLFAFWSIYVQFALGRGTPVPLMATQKLIVQPPYTYCRNPMVLGAMALYLGVAVLHGTLGATLLVVYIERLEEKEMELRFGQDYIEYR